MFFFPPWKVTSLQRIEGHTVTKRQFRAYCRVQKGKFFVRHAQDFFWPNSS